MTRTKLLVIEPLDKELKKNERLAEVLAFVLEGIPHETVRTAGELARFLETEKAATAKRSRTAEGSEPFEKRVLFVVSLGEYGVNLEYCRILRYLREREPRRILGEYREALPDGYAGGPPGENTKELSGGYAGGALDGYTGGLVVDGDSELYTKYTAKELVFTANCAGCAFVGRPLVEGTKTLTNFAIVAQNMDTDLPTAYKKSARQLVEELLASRKPAAGKPNLLVLHASSHVTSNTYALWNRVKGQLEDCSITEIGLRNGALSDCAGCPYKMCLHFGEKGSCFYGGVMVEDVYPAVKKADAIILLCPNYNDALSANLTAFINRLTALFRTTRFYDKALFAIVVSGYSGSDIVAGQLIAALNMNKTFYLPGRFAMMETANNAGTAVKLPGIDRRLRQFADNIRQTLTDADPDRNRQSASGPEAAGEA